MGSLQKAPNEQAEKGKIMHYKHKRTAKEKSTSFYLSKNLLEKLDFIADLEGQSRSVIVEMCVEFYMKGTNDETEFCRAKRKLYKKQRSTQRTRRRKAKKDIQLSQENEQSLFKTEERTEKQTAHPCDLQGV